MRSYGARLLGALALTALLATAPLTIAGPLAPVHGAHGGHGSGGDHFAMVEVMMDQLDLSDSQRGQIKRLMKQQHDMSKVNRDEMKLRHDELAGLMHADYFDENAIRLVADAVAQAQAEVIMAHAALMWEIRQVLTPEQIEKIKGIHEMHQGIMKKHSHLHERQPSEK